jgi:Raf kinase inhibitor-like YbhB/YbcL family protein
MKAIGLLFLCALVMPVTSLVQAESAPDAASLQMTSSAFRDGGKIPAKYTCDSSNVNPPLRLENLPETVKSLVLIVDDPDAPGKTWTHWLVWNVDPKTIEIREGGVPINAVEGTNDFGKPAYGGPCPPSGSHRYYFKVYALDTTLLLPSSAKRDALEKAMTGHVLTKGSLLGTYSRGQ